MTADLTELAGDSSPLSAHQTTSSAESNFRELDDAFLQNQARIWLGEVLHIRFDEQVDISELLADGELLFEVFEVISRMLPTLYANETQLKVCEWKTLASNKSTRRYLPYHNVDSFVRMCKKLGMDGIDLFTPSDVVEKRNTRKVCMCLRSLSRKSRLRDLNVPDFDSVTCTFTMPTDMVGCIRKSLEMSQSSSSLSVEQEAEKVSRVRFWRRMSNSESVVSNGVSDNSDEAESKFVVAESNGASDFVDEAESPYISGPQLIRDIDSTLQLSMTSDFKIEDNDQCECLSPSKAESVGSPCSQYFSDEELGIAISNCLGSRISGKVAEPNSESNNGYRSGDVSHIPLHWGNDHLDVGNDNDANSNVDDIDCASQEKDVDTTCSNNYGNHMCNENLENLDSTSEVDCHKSLEFVTDDSYACEDPRLSYDDDPPNNNATKPEPFVCEVWPDNGAPCSHGKTNDNVIPAEQILQSSCVSKSESSDYLYKDEIEASSAHIEVINVGGNSCCDRLKNGNANSDVGDFGGQLRFYEEQSPCSVDFDEYNCKNSNLLALKSNCYEDCMGDKENELFDVPHLDVNSSPDMVVAKSKTHCSKDCPNANEESEGQNAFAEGVDDKPIDIKIAVSAASFATVINDSQLEAHSPQVLENELFNVPHLDLNSSPDMVVAKSKTHYSKDCPNANEESEGQNALVEGVDDKPIDIEIAVSAASFATVINDSQLEAQSPQDLENELFDVPHLDVNSSPEMVVAKSKTHYSEDCPNANEESEGQNAVVEGVDDKPIDIDVAVSAASFATVINDSQLEAQSPQVLEDTDQNQLQEMKGESGFLDEESINKELPLHKPRRKLLKSFFKGTALLGVAVFLLFLRKNRQASQSGAKKRLPKIVVQGAPKSSQKGGSSSSVYPAEKLNLGI